ncbi:MAG: CBS domain-containing protein [Candidatus Omnitrophota bacterium]|nr:CBS domain-containing protein [Candidatus Omnitrophota bacterium]
MKVKEIMTREIISVSPQMSAKEALEVLFKHRISGLPVIDENGKLAGMFTEKDVLTAALPSYVSKVGKFIYDENPKAIKRKMSQLDKIKVKDIMRKEVVTTEENVTLCEVARLMLTQNARRIPVVDKNGIIKGIIAREDIVKAFAKEVEA